MSFRDAFTRNNRQAAKTEPQPLRTNRQQLDEKLVEEALTKIELVYVRKEYGYYVGQFGNDMSMVVEVSLVGADQLMIT